MIELRWLTSPHPKFEGSKVKKLQYRTFQLVHGNDLMQLGTSICGYWSEWQDVPEVEAEKR